MNCNHNTVKFYNRQYSINNNIDSNNTNNSDNTINTNNNNATKLSDKKYLVKLLYFIDNIWDKYTNFKLKYYSDNTIRLPPKILDIRLINLDNNQITLLGRGREDISNISWDTLKQNFATSNLLVHITYQIYKYDQYSKNGNNEPGDIYKIVLSTEDDINLIKDLSWTYSNLYQSIEDISTNILNENSISLFYQYAGPCCDFYKQSNITMNSYGILDETLKKMLLSKGQFIRFSDIYDNIIEFKVI